MPHAQIQEKLDMLPVTLSNASCTDTGKIGHVTGYPERVRNKFVETICTGHSQPLTSIYVSFIFCWIYRPFTAEGDKFLEALRENMLKADEISSNDSE